MQHALPKSGDPLYLQKARDDHPAARAQSPSLPAEALGNYIAESALRDGYQYNPVARGFVALTCATDIYSIKSLSGRISNSLYASVCVDVYSDAVCFCGLPESKTTH